MTAMTEAGKFEQVLQRVDPESRLRRVWELTGGISARITALEILRSDGSTKKLIVRRHREGELRQRPNAAADEFKLLRVLHAAGVAAPEPYYFDQSGELFPTPYIVMEYIEGESELLSSQVADLPLQLAAHLARVHQVDISRLDLSFLPRIEQRFAEKLRVEPARVDESLDEGRIRDALEAAWPLSRPNAPALLHGDFWPGNVLWRDGQPVAIIDWEDAAIGDPLADVANGRLEILWVFGIEAMNSFTRRYQSLTAIDFTCLPYWDLCAALRPISKAAEWSTWVAGERTMRERHKWFVAQTFEKLDRIA